MKRLLPLIPILILFFIVSSCNGAPIINTDDLKTLVAAATQTAKSWTPIPTSTSNPNLNNMVFWLNDDLAKANTLERTMDAIYQVTNISVSNVSNSSDLVLQVDVGCICMNDNKCCIPERTFVEIIETMKTKKDLALAQIPGNINQIMIVCYDHTKDVPIGSISASWTDVRDYLQGYNSGYQLGVRITRTAAP